MEDPHALLREIGHPRAFHAGDAGRQTEPRIQETVLFRCISD